MKVVLAYVLKGPCKNWEPALQIARRVSGCGRNGTHVTCPDCSIPCNNCQFLEDGFFPVAHIVPHINFSIHAISAVGVPIGSRDGVKEASYRNWICELPQVTDILARAMVHESIHLCKEVVPATPSMSDGPLRGLLGINPWPFPPDTEDLVNECWKNIERSDEL